MKKNLLYIFLLVFNLLHAQVKITGKVIDHNGDPLPGASVYLNSTTIGTTTDFDGYFHLNVEHGYYTMVASYVGFETSLYSLNTLEVPDMIVFKMVEAYNTLDEIVLKNEKQISGKRAYFLKQFRKAFLGQSFIAKKSKIKNEDVLKFEYDAANEILEAYAVEPLIIENKGLGYKITYDLIHFELQAMTVRFLGYTRYEDLKGNDRKKRKWATERELSYGGSLRHFLQSAVKNDTLSGFEVDKIRLIPNPERPSDEQILEAEAFVSKHGGLQKSPFNRDPKIDKKLKAAQEILKKAELNKFTELILQKKIPIKDYFRKDEDGFHLFSKNKALRITYKKEYQESNYVSPDETFSTKKHQVSRVTFYDDSVLVNPIGLFHNPLDVLLEGYWGFEKVGDLLPLDYKPETMQPEK